MKYKRSGFTIVELLIVVVVIAILASITLVSYNGIQRRAHNTVVNSAVSSWIEVLRASYVVNGTIDVEIPPGDNSICLGTKEQYPYINSDLREGQCYVFAHTSDELIAIMRSTVGDINMKTFVTDDGSYPFRGVQYGFANTEVDGVYTADIWWDLRGPNQDCEAVPGGYAYSNDTNGLTQCTVDVKALLGGVPVRTE